MKRSSEAFLALGLATIVTASAGGSAFAQQDDPAIPTWANIRPAYPIATDGTPLARTIDQPGIGGWSAFSLDGTAPKARVQIR